MFGRVVKSDVKSCEEPSRALRGTIINSWTGEKGSVRGTTRRPSLEMDATLRYLLTFLKVGDFFEGACPLF